MVSRVLLRWMIRSAKLVINFLTTSFYLAGFSQMLFIAAFA